jgi:uncharacterized damage-inducible protein DinB
MTYYGSKELAASFRTVRGNTILIAEAIPEEKYGFRAAPETRSVSQMLAHIAVSTRFQSHVHVNRVTDMKTLNFEALFQEFVAEENKPRSKTDLIALLKSEGDAFAVFLDGVNESLLSEQVTLPPGAQPQSKSRFEMLLSAKEHEMHHRAQLMLIQRMLGQVPHLTRVMQERMAARAATAQAQP